MGDEEKRFNILGELAGCSGYDMALLTTFNFEIGFFERAVLNRLFARDIKTVSLFVDAKQLTNALKEFDIAHNGSHIGKKYMVTPVKMGGSFHPKVILLLGEKKAKLIVGSGNLETFGYTSNNEVFNCVDYTPDQPKYLDVIVAAIDFFDAINEISYKLDNSVIKAAREYVYYHRTARNEEVSLLHNMKLPILEQVPEFIPGDVESISIAVPYYDKELLALQQVQERFPNARISLFIQNRSSTFPVEYNEQRHIAEDIHTFSRFRYNAKSSNGNFYHGKVFLFKTGNRAYVLYGSANCTLSALTRTHENGGNVECTFFETGGVSDFDYFFESMELEEGEKLTSQKMVFETSAPPVFSFRYGEVKESVELHIGFTKACDGLTVKLGDRELEYSKTKDEIVVYIDGECRDVLTDIFEISMICGEYTEVLRCWTFNRATLVGSREVQDRMEDLEDFEINSSGDKYIEDRMRVLRAEATTQNEILEYKNNLKYMNQIKMEQEEDREENEDFVVDYQIPDEYRYAYRQYSALSRIRNLFVRRFIGTPFSWDLNDERTPKADVSESKDEPHIPVRRKATSDEIRFERFIKGKVKGMMSDKYVSIIEPDHYIGIVEVILDIFHRYCNVEDVEDIFTMDYVVDTRSRFMWNIIGKSLEGLSNREEMQEAIIRNGFQTILENYLFYRELPDRDERWKYESLNKMLLTALEEKYHLRQTYVPVIQRVIFEGKGGVLTLGVNGACAYIEDLYGYKTLEMLQDTVAAVYPGAETSLQDSSLRIQAEMDQVTECLKLDTGILREIANFSRNVTKIAKVYIDFIDLAACSSGGNPLVKIRHTVNMDSHQWRYAMIRANGDREDSKSQYLAF